MTNDSEPRALSAALAAPAFVTRGMGSALHAANRHVERWAPEADTSRVRPMRSLGFVDRLVAPWMETAQRSASMRLFSQYANGGMGERAGTAVSWVFPRPWYQDELDWMAAARQVRSSPVARTETPSLLTTRGTYVAPAIAAPQVAMPSALYEYVAPSLSLAAAQPAAIPGVGYGGETMRRGEAYSPLISLASVQAAELMSRAVSPLAAQRHGAPVAGMPAPPMAAGPSSAMTPGLRSVLTAILARAAAPQVAELPPSRLAMSAPHLETPPAPNEGLAPVTPQRAPSVASAQATEVADQYAEQRAHIVELQRIAQRDAIARAETARAQAAEAGRGQAARSAASAPAAATGASPATQAAQIAAAQAQIAAAQDAQRASAAQTAAAQTAAAAASDTQRAASSQAAAETAAAQQAGTAEVRAAAERAEAELRARIGTTRASEAQQSAADRARAEAIVAAAERARVEERIAQRLAERTGGQRLHEQSRAEAAAHVRTPLEPARATSAPAAPIAPATPAEYRPSPEVAAAIAGLPPELAAMLAPVIAQRPERAMQAIRELNDTLRTVELLARSSATGASFEATRGPRLVMPAGLGGLVSAVDRAQSIAERPAVLGGQRPIVPLADRQPDAPRAQARPERDVRMPALAWLSPVTRPQVASPVTALGATTTATPAALSHVAWADRWLARFAGAAPQSLDMISAAAAAAPEVRLQALASAAPGAVFVVPEMMRGDLASERARPRTQAAAGATLATSPSVVSGTAATSPAVSSPPAQVPGMRLINPPGEPLRRFDDDAETPDDVFTAIAASAARNRTAAARPQPVPGSIAAQAQAQVQALAAQAQAAQAQGPAVDRSTLADLVAHSAPSAPGAGLSAQLSSSPFAPALRHVLPSASSASFDVRALFGAGLGATYLAGLIGPASRELEIGTQLAPAWASWSEAPLNQQGGDRLDRTVPSFDAAYVQAEALEATDSPTTGAARALEQQRAELLGEQLRTGDARDPAEPQRQLEQLRAAEQRATEAAGGATSESAAAIAAAIQRGILPAASLTTLRTALLSWEVSTTSSEVPGGAPVSQLVPGSFATSQPAARTGAGEAAYAVSPARAMIEAMSLPMLGDTHEERAPAWLSPGMVADRAHAWSIAQERSTSDLAFDFVTPELVLAARVYGLGPAEAAQAARLAVVGPGQLGAMASTVDRTFVEALAIGRDARNVEAERLRRGTSSAALTGAASDLARPDAPSGMAPSFLAPGEAESAALRARPASPIGADGRVAITTAFPTADGTIAAAVAPTTRAALPPASGASFGVDRRAPRGAFLWPAATIAALGLNAAGSDGQLSMSVAALEMLAAQVVVELGTFTALSEADAAARSIAGEPGAAGAFGAAAYGAGGYAASVAGAYGSSGGGPLVASAIGGAGAASLDPATGAPATDAATGAAIDPRTGAPAARPDAVGILGTLAARRTAEARAAGAEPAEADVLTTAAALVPAGRRARFDALYVALSQSSEGRSWSPAARAARALALAGRGEGPAASARERAASAWDVLPVVYPSVLGAVAGAPEGVAGSPELAADGPGSAASSAAALMASYVSLSPPSGPDGRRLASPAPRSARTTARPGGLAGGRDAGGRDLVSGGGEYGRFAGAGDDMVHVTSSPGLGGLSARAGNALGAYVNPVAPPAAPIEASSGSSAGTSGAVLRPPTAAPEYVQTGRRGGRYGGGEVEIPAWFESAARRMLAERSGDSEGISIAELTLVTAAPATHIAAASVTPAAPSPTTPGAATASQSANAPKIDVDKIANELYHEIMTMMDVARSRNGNPYQ